MNAKQIERLIQSAVEDERRQCVKIVEDLADSLNDIVHLKKPERESKRGQRIAYSHAALALIERQRELAVDKDGVCK